MGVHQLWDILGPTARPVRLESLSRKRLAVDASIWIYQFLKAVRDAEGNSIGPSHIVGFFRRICKLLYYGILPVFVFDGGAPALKRETLALRKKRREHQAESKRHTAQKLLAMQLHSSRSNKNNYYDNPMTSTDAPPPSKRFRKQDDFHLPTLYEFRTSDRDERVLRGEGVPHQDNYDFDIVDGININTVDPESKEFAQLAKETQYMILSHLRLKSRLRMGYRKEDLEDMFPDSYDFSRFQIKQVQKRNFYTQRLMEASGMSGDNTLSTHRVAGEQDREYQLVKSENGWTLSLGGKNSASSPIQLDEYGNEIKSNPSSSPIKSSPVKRSPSKLHSSPTKVVALSSDSEQRDADNLDAINQLYAQMNDSDEEKKEPSPTPAYIPKLTDFAPQTETYTEPPLKTETEDVQLKEENDDDDDFAFGSSLLAAPAQSKSNPSQDKIEEDDDDDDFEDVPLHEAQIDEVIIDNGSPKKTLDNEVKPKHDAGVPVGNATIEKTSAEAMSFEVEDNGQFDSEPIEVLQVDEKFEQGGDEVVEVDNGGSDSKPEKIETTSQSKPITLPPTEPLNPPDSTTVDSDDNESNLPQSSPVSRNPDWFSQDLNNPHMPRQTVASKEMTKPSTSSNADGLISWGEAQELLEDDDVEDSTFEADDIQEVDPAIEKLLPSSPAKEDLPSSELQAPAEVVDYEFEEEEEDEIAKNLAAEENLHEKFNQQMADTYRSTNKTSNSSIQAKQLLQEKIARAKRDSDEVTQNMVLDVQDLLSRFGIPFIVAPMEAEAQCAELQQLGLVDGIITDDSDCFLFNGTKVYKNMFNQTKYVECYQLPEIDDKLGLSRDKLIELALLLGSDYTEGIKGVGPVLAVEILAEFGDLKSFKEWYDRQLTTSLTSKPSDEQTKLQKTLATRVKTGKLSLPENFPDSVVIRAYTHPEVDRSKSPFKWGIPNLDRIRTFLMYNVNWSQERVDEIMVPLVQDLNRKKAEGTQSTLGEFFPQEYLSSKEINLGKRLKAATTKMTKRKKK
ncbi:hypothetical protein DIURU_002864 [Diutina rugosa]|uniref:XPG-I domain-containing protein n=1 Tax=Diutina rugosa TaxID=5481 RepID=A0A642UNR5_DIURU|nr:uncharacterized protein DIURU_002864 [Diutina rugosa]KAA8902410.1 hypothetical protein DIURU_002864 [Diutina rugosa]